MCFCSFDNCNPAATMLLKYAAKSSNWYNVSCLGIIIISGILLSNYQCSLLSPFFTIMNKKERSHTSILVRQSNWPSDRNGKNKLPNVTTGSAVQPTPTVTVAGSIDLETNGFFDVTALVQEVHETRQCENNKSSCGQRFGTMRASIRS